MDKYYSLKNLLILLCISFIPLVAKADVLLVAPTGELEQVPWQARSKWIWEEIQTPKEIVPGFTLKELPVFATEIIIPANVGLRPVSGEPLILDRKSENAEVEYEHWLLRSREFPPHAHVEIANDKEKKKRELLVLAAPLEQIFVLHESCRDLGVAWSHVRATDLNSLKSYLGAYCMDTGGSVLIAFIRPHSSNVSPRWKMGAKKIPSDQGFDVYEIDKGSDPTPGRKLIGQALVKAKSGAKAKAKLSIDRLKAYRRFSAGIGTGLTYLSYKEDPGAITASGAAVSVKGGVLYHLIPKKLEIDAGAYINVLPMFYSVKGARGSPHFWGVNLRAGYVLPRLENGLQFKVLAGPYMWGMIVPNKSYGITNLAGGQIFGALEIPRDQWKKASVYLKFAPIGQTFSNMFSFNNYEVALGGSYDLGNLLFSLPVGLMADVSYFKVGKLTTSFNKFSLTTMSLSLGVRF